MSSFSDGEVISGQLFVTNTESTPLNLGVGAARIDGSTYLQGPAVVGSDKAFPIIGATLMVAPLQNIKSTSPIVPGTLCTGNHSPYSLAVIGSSAFMGTVDAALGINVGTNLIAQGEVMSRCGKHILSAKKNFDIPHPSKEGWRLRHTCPEAPTNDVYVRGRIKNKTEIKLPNYWKDFVDQESITVNLTPIGSHQNIIVKRIDETTVYLQSNGGLPIDCFYHIFAERKDGEKLIAEYKGQTPADYPGNNDEYSVSGYHYDIKE